MLSTIRRMLLPGLRSFAFRSGQTREKRAVHTTGQRLAFSLNDFQLRKITQDFDHVYDTDGDGFIDSADINAFKRRLRKYTEEFHGKAVKDVYKAGYDDYWSILLESADTNKDGYISREEWVHLWEDIVAASKDISPASLPQWVRLVPHSLFPVLDIKGDGVLDKDEYRNFWHFVGGYRLASDEDLDRYFAHMTEGGEKPLDLPRVQQLFADFYLSPDPATPGRYIAGPIKFRLDN